MGRLIIWVATLVLAGFLSLGTAAQAQNPYSAAYAVNDSIISHYDIDQRIRLLRVLGFRGGDIREFAVNQLIEDRLKIEAARLTGAQLRDGSVERAIETAAENGGTTGDRLWAQARAAGVSRDAFEEYYAIQLLWRQIVQARFREIAAPVGRDVDYAIDAAAAQTQYTVLLAEIALPFAERGEQATIAFAERLSRDLNAGADFATAVQNFSRSPTAANGGAIGWVQPDAMPANFASAIAGLRVGQVSAPIRVSAGVLLIKIVSSRVITSPLRAQQSVKYAVVDFSGTPNAIAAAQAMQPGMDQCAENRNTLAEYGGESGLFGPVPKDSVPTDIALALARLNVGGSEIAAMGDRVRLIQLCERTTELEQPILNQVRGSVLGQKLDALANGYLLELRRAAIIEER